MARSPSSKAGLEGSPLGVGEFTAEMIDAPSPEVPEEIFVAETERVEWKQSLRDTAKVGKAVGALANDLGDTKRLGYVVIGLDDKGTPVGAFRPGENVDEAQRSLIGRLTSKLLPPPSFDLKLVERAGVDLLIVVVAPCPVPPLVRYDGEVFVRVGPTTRHPSSVDLARLQERRPMANLPFDLRPFEGATVDDLGASLKTLYEVERDSSDDPESYPPLEGWLKQQDLGRPVGGIWRPNPAALLVYGGDPQSFFPGATIEFARYPGVDDEVMPAERKTISGTLPSQLDALWAQLVAHNYEVPSAPAGIRAGFAPAYPEEALKELARNLVQHRLYDGSYAPARVNWYEDRVVFTNAGPPPGLAREAEFGDHSDYRNPTVTNHLRKLGYVQKLGTGVSRARAQLTKNGNAPLEVETNGYTTVTVRGRR